MANENKDENKTNPPVVNPTSANPSTKTDKEEEVSIKTSVLEGILKEISDLKATVGQIEQTAPQDQIRKIEALRASGKLVKSVKIRRFEGKLVTVWKTIKDNVWVADGKLNEEQVVLLTFEDSKTKEVNLTQFTRGTTYEPYEVIKESKTAEGIIELTVQLPNGKELVISSQYVN